MPIGSCRNKRSATESKRSPYSAFRRWVSNSICSLVLIINHLRAKHNVRFFRCSKTLTCELSSNLPRISCKLNRYLNQSFSYGESETCLFKLNRLRVPQNRDQMRDLRILFETSLS